MNDMNEVTCVCKCGNSKFFVIEGYDVMCGSYVYIKCAECKEDAGISANNYGEITTDLEGKRDEE